MIICGAAGVGKSRYGRALARESGAYLLDSDTVTEPVVRAGMRLAGLDPDDRDSREYREAFREPVYECLYDIARENLEHCDVILVGPFTSEIQDAGWLEGLRRDFRAEIEVIYLRCSAEVRRDRVERRGNPRDRAKLAAWDEHALRNADVVPAFDCKIVNT